MPQPPAPFEQTFVGVPPAGWQWTICYTTLDSGVRVDPWSVFTPVAMRPESPGMAIHYFFEEFEKFVKAPAIEAKVREFTRNAQALVHLQHSQIVSPGSARRRAVVTGDWLRIILPKKHPRNDFDFGKTDESQHRQLVRLLPVRWVLAKKDKVEFIM